MLTEDQARALLGEAGDTISVAPEPTLLERARRARRGRRLITLSAAAAVATVVAGGTAIGVSDPSTGPAPAAPGRSTPAASTKPPTSRTVTVPALEGLEEQVATARLQELGLRVSYFVGDSCEPPGSVMSVDPEPGTAVTPDSTVELVVSGSAGPGTCEEQRVLHARDQMIVDRFVAFAKAPSATTEPFAPRVALGLGDSVRGFLSERETADPAAWELPGPYGQWTGPFSALEYLAEAEDGLDVGNNLATRARIVCATRPAGPPPRFREAHLISIQPDSGEDASCLDWWSVDLAVDDAGRITGVLLTLGDP